MLAFFYIINGYLLTATTFTLTIAFPPLSSHTEFSLHTSIIAHGPQYPGFSRFSLSPEKTGFCHPVSMILLRTGD